MAFSLLATATDPAFPTVIRRAIYGATGLADEGVRRFMN
jgi:hypothetical protein